jgi:hypothetical protein
MRQEIQKAHSAAGGGHMEALTGIEIRFGGNLTAGE